MWYLMSFNVWRLWYIGSLSVIVELIDVTNTCETSQARPTNKFVKMFKKNTHRNVASFTFARH